MAISDSRKAIGRYLRDAIGGSPRVSKYHDAAEAKEIDILAIAGEPDAGSTAIATIGLSDHDLGLTAGGKPLRIELVMVHRTGQDRAANVLATSAFDIIDRAVAVRPDDVLEDEIAEYFPDSPLRHLLLADPFIWDLPTLDLPDRRVAFLHAVPIAPGELAVAERQGTPALLDLLEQGGADVADLERAPLA